MELTIIDFNFWKKWEEVGSVGSGHCTKFKIDDSLFRMESTIIDFNFFGKKWEEVRSGIGK